MDSHTFRFVRFIQEVEAVRSRTATCRMAPPGLTSLITALCILLGPGIASISAQDPLPPGSVMPPGSSVDGKTIANWQTDFWDHGLSFPISDPHHVPGEDPLTDLDGDHQGDGQSGPVWLLCPVTGPAVNAPVTRTFEIPNDKYILVPLITIAYHYIPQAWGTCADNLQIFCGADCDANKKCGDGGCCADAQHVSQEVADLQCPGGTCTLQSAEENCQTSELFDFTDSLNFSIDDVSVPEADLFNHYETSDFWPGVFGEYNWADAIVGSWPGSCVTGFTLMITPFKDNEERVIKCGSAISAIDFHIDVTNNVTFVPEADLFWLQLTAIGFVALIRRRRTDEPGATNTGAGD